MARHPHLGMSDVVVHPLATLDLGCGGVDVDAVDVELVGDLVGLRRRGVLVLRDSGVLASQRVGSLTLNSRGDGSIRIAPDLSFLGGRRR